MWIKRDFSFKNATSSLPIKVLKGPRQVGKSSFLARLGGYEMVYLDDLALRKQASENPRFFLDQLPDRIVLDEGTLVPELFTELKRRVDENRRTNGKTKPVDVWITGSNQTLLQKEVQESLAGRASYFDFNTLSIHELKGRWQLSTFLFRGGWPELAVNQGLSPVRYLNDLVSTFIEKDIIASAGIERRAAFLNTLSLTASRVGQLINYSDIARNVGADLTTVQSWLSIVQTNGILRQLRPYHSNLNQRLIKAPKYYFEDVALATRLQGWTEMQPLMTSPQLGHLIENIVVSEVSRFFLNRGEIPTLYFVRSKEKVEVDLIVDLGNQKWLAIEVKTSPQDFTKDQMKLLNNLDLNIIQRWVVSPIPSAHFPNARTVEFTQIWSELAKICPKTQGD